MLPSGFFDSSGTEFTPNCGLGWRFSYSISPDTNSFRAADGNPLQCWRITLSFDPHLIRTASYGRLMFSTHVEHLVCLLDDPVATECNLPLRYNSAFQLGAFIYSCTALETPIISIRVELPAELQLLLPHSLDSRVERVLADTMRGDEAVDIKFYAYTRSGAGYVSHPRPVFAKASVLRGYSDVLDLRINGGEGFVESRVVDMNRHIIDEEYFYGYDYMSDSDLDTDDEGDKASSYHSPFTMSTRPQTPGLAQIVPLPSTPQLHESHRLSHVELGRSNDSPSTTPPRSQTPGLTEIVPLRTSAPQLHEPLVPDFDSPRLGRVVQVRGTAFKTWNAMLYYLYTKKIRFRTMDFPRPPGSSMPECSAKSMYRLADELGLEDLKALALSSLRSQLSQENIVREAFSTFTSMYTEIQDIEVDFLVVHPSAFVAPSDLDVMLRRICEGRHLRSFDVLRKIIQRLRPL
ncbi:hypothetical protein B0H10DRAFT_2061567 [Mycena sp. CBHHK59/15]|nr:hypothetical protein B0H10DRAFT_2061567 [Mycena sp. CBHHK59/15]